MEVYIFLTFALLFIYTSRLKLSYGKDNPEVGFKVQAH